jgi:hypothetical protein
VKPQRTWLIQRLTKPIQFPKGHFMEGKDNPFAFGGGFRNGGLSKEAMDILRPIFSFDYMGAAEFEFGVIPKAIQFIAENRKDFAPGEIIVPFNRIRLDKFEKSYYQPLGTGCATIYTFTHRDHAAHADDIITKLLTDKFELKETTMLRESYLTRKEDSEYQTRTCGWLELDNGFFFFKDKEMHDKIVGIFTEKAEEAK